MSHLEIWFQAIALLLMGYLMAMDFRFRKLPNLTILALLLTFAACVVVNPPPQVELLMAFVCAGLAFGGMLVLYFLGGMAAGDVKLAFAAFLWATPSNFQFMLGAFAVSTLLLAGIYSIFGSRDQPEKTIPMGVPLSLAGMVAVILR